MEQSRLRTGKNLPTIRSGSSLVNGVAEPGAWGAPERRLPTGICRRGRILSLSQTRSCCELRSRSLTYFYIESEESLCLVGINAIARRRRRRRR